ncbi:hypothetical protein [Paenibacillus sp. NPDC058174]|uniref:hypothetical protein n=1 Tax=Paenibacillus sp. NPDC058174 TaxID=3346366 RepID=UPI0036DF1445
MKPKYLLFSVSCGLALTIGIAAYTNGNVNKYPNQQQVRLSSAKLQVYNFEEAVKNSDLIIKVEIGKKVRELIEPSAKTLFQATIIDEWKGDPLLESKEINILQQGNSQLTFNDNDLFVERDRYVLFLKKAVTVSEPNTYWILGEETGIYKDDSSGKLVKQSLYDKQLEDIEDKILTANLQKKNRKEVQVIDEQLLKEKIMASNEGL